MSAINQIVAGYGLDPDASAFIAAAGITDGTQQSAVDRLVKDFKGYGIWTKMLAIYPFVGGTSTTHKYNLKDPRDLDAAFRLTFSGITHASTGITPNGTNGFADTKFNPSTNLSSDNDSHMSVYSRTNSVGDKTDFGSYDGGSKTWRIIARLTGDFFYTESYTFSGTAIIQTTNTDSRGHFICNRTGASVYNQWKNGSKTGTSTTSTQTRPSATTYLGLLRTTPQSPSDREIAFASIGTGLTDTEAANLYTAVQAYQVSLSRSV